MRIQKLVPIHERNSYELSGLEFTEMKDLKGIVALFGKNGAGKTRLLNYVKSFVNTIGSMRNDPLHTIAGSNFSLNDSDGLIVDYANNSLFLIEPGRYQVENSDNMSESAYRTQTFHVANNPTFQDVSEKCMQIIKALFKSELSSKYKEVIGDNKGYMLHDQLVSKNDELLQSIRFLIKQFTGKEISCHYDEFSFPILYYGGHQLNQYTGLLSQGEEALIAMSVFFTLQAAAQGNPQFSFNVLRDKIVIIDEPELFLHPEAQIKMIDKLKELIGNGQIWMATHSLPLLSILEKEEIWLLKDGKVISPSIETPGNAVSELVGEENILKLESFLSSQYEWAAIKFAIESLFPPDQASYKEADPQQSQITNYLGVPTKDTWILDFGAGTGRIGLEILRNLETAKRIYYQTLEQNSENRLQLTEVSKNLQDISGVDKDYEREVLDSYKKLGETKYKTFYDLVLLVNVLHEVPIHHWEEVLNNILSCLKDDGKILILEDQHLPKGENAHEFGYLIMGIEEFQSLFNLKNKPKQFLHSNPKYKERLLCIEINKSDAAVNKASIKSALERKKNNCDVAIKAIKNKVKPTAIDGRLYQFYAQLHYNVDNALIVSS